MMTNEFGNYLRSNAQIADDDIRRISDLATTATVRRNENILNAGDICRQKIFVVKGMLRLYGTSDDGSEHIVQFSPENSWTLDAESYDNQTPSRVNIGAVEASEILLWTKADFEMLRNTIPGLRAFSEKIISRNVYASRQRILTSISATPEEKYAEFVQMFPDYLSRLPLRMISAYLGISVKTLTRISHAQLTTK